MLICPHQGWRKDILTTSIPPGEPCKRYILRLKVIYIKYISSVNLNNRSISKGWDINLLDAAIDFPIQQVPQQDYGGPEDINCFHRSGVQEVAGSPVSCVESAFKYSWIKSTTLTQLFIWTTETFLDSSIKSFIQNRRKGSEGKPS